VTTQQTAEEIEALTQQVVAALEDKKASDILVIDVRGRCPWADRFVLASGKTGRQLNAMAQSMSEIAHQHRMPARIEGLEAMEWLVVDLQDVVVHLFIPEVRASFQLEQLWTRAKPAA